MYVHIYVHVYRLRINTQRRSHLRYMSTPFEIYRPLEGEKERETEIESVSNGVESCRVT